MKKILKNASAVVLENRIHSIHRKYKYTKYVPDLPGRNTVIVGVVLFKFRETETGAIIQNNYLATAYQKAKRVE